MDQCGAAGGAGVGAASLAQFPQGRPRLGLPAPCGLPSSIFGFS